MKEERKESERATDVSKPTGEDGRWTAAEITEAGGPYLQ